MKPRHPNRLTSVNPARVARILLIPWLLTVGSLPASAQSSESPQATIASVRGTNSWIQRNGATREQPAYATQQLFTGDQGRTGLNNQMILQMADLTVAYIEELSVFNVKAPPEETSTLFTLFRGLTYFFHRDKPGDVEIRSRTASAASRGTEFTVEVDDKDRMTVTMTDGEVELKNAQGSLVLVSGEQGVAEPGRPPYKTAVINAINAVQWCLYYPGVIDPAELPLPAAEQSALSGSLFAYRQGDLLGALSAYPPDRTPQSPEERLYLAAVLLAVGKVDETRAILNGLPGTDPGLTQLAGALRRVIAAVRLEVDPEDAGEFGLASEWLADSYYQQSAGNLARALSSARNAVRQSPGFGFGWTRLAELQFSHGHNDAAMTSLDKSLDLAPGNAQAHALMGFLLSARNRFGEALNYFESALMIDGGLGNAWLGRGLVRLHQGKVAPGLADLEIAAAVEPQRALLRSYLGKAFSNAGDTRRALAELDLARNLDPKDPTPSLYAALMLQQQSRVNQAVRALESSQQLAGNRRVYRSQHLLDQDRAVQGANLASIYRDAGMSEVSFQEAARAVSQDYANHSAHLFLNNSYEGLRDLNAVNLRFETAAFTEFFLANLLAPPGAGTLAQTVSQQEYSKLFEKNHVGLSSASDYQSNGEWLQSVVQHGAFDNSAYAASAVYLYQNGDEPNTDRTQNGFALRLKQQVTGKDSLFVQAIYQEFEAGDLTQYYDPASANPDVRIKEVLSPMILAGHHHRWSPANHTLLLAGGINDTVTIDNPRHAAPLLNRDPAGDITFAGRMSDLDLDYHHEQDLYTAEAQHIFQGPRDTIIGGGRYQTGTYQTDSSLTGFPPIVGAMPSQDFSSDFERLSAYSYYHRQWLPGLLTVAGLSYDRLIYPRNFRLAPVSSAEKTTDKLSPKAGIIWTPTPATTLRAAYTRSLGGVSLDQSLRLEPSQVAGFTQAYRNLVPEVAESANAFETAGFSLEQRLASGTYLGLSLEGLRSEVDRDRGVVEFNFSSGFHQTTTLEHLAFEERLLTLTLNQLIGDFWSIGARYRLSNAQLKRDFPEIPPSAALSGLERRQNLESTLHQLQLFAIYNHSSGVFYRADSIWSSQHSHGYAQTRPGEDFWQFNAFVGYRFPRRRAELRAGLLNLTGQDYRMDTLNLASQLPRGRSLSLRFLFNF